MNIFDADSLCLATRLDQLSRVLIDSVAAGASISFMAPLPEGEAADFWLDAVRPELAAGRRVLFCAEHRGRIVGTVQLITTLPPNQPHRCEVAKLIVHPEARRLGIGRALMMRAIERAGAEGKTLMTLDTATGGDAQRLYTSLGFELAGVIPDFAWGSDGLALHGTSLMYRRIQGIAPLA